MRVSGSMNGQKETSDPGGNVIGLYQQPAGK
jgi:hypothetical protein